MIPPILNCGGGGDRVVIRPRFYIFGSLRKGNRRSGAGADISYPLLTFDNSV